VRHGPRGADGLCAVARRVGWRPFLPQTDIDAIAAQLTTAVSCRSRRLRSAWTSSADCTWRSSLLFLPLGSLLAVWPLRLRGGWAQLWPGVWLALAIEAGHLVIVDRYFDLTNALIACAGLGIGWLAMRRSGFRPYGERWGASESFDRGNPQPNKQR